MPAPLIFLTTYAIKDGELEAGTEATIVQISQEADSIKHYWRAVHDHTGRELDRFVVSPTSVQIYGPTAQIMLDRTRHSAGSGAAVTVMPEHVGGFTRLGPAASESVGPGRE